MTHAPGSLLTPNDVDEFRSLLERHLGVSLPAEKAAPLAHQLLRVLWLIRSVAETRAGDFKPPVDNALLAESRNRGIDSNSSPP